MSWRNVPMPTAVSKLPTDKRGFPVPWVSCWASDENVADPVAHRPVDLGWAAALMPTAFCDHVAGRGVPDLGSLCPGRQIEGMLNRLCDVCGEFVPPGPIYFMGAYNLLDGAIGFRECGLHCECALYAGQVCPGLIVPKAGKDVGVFTCTAYTLQPQFYWSVDGTKAEHKYFLGFDDPELLLLLKLAQQGRANLALTGAYAVPINPTITHLSDWVTYQKEVSA